MSYLYLTTATTGLKTEEHALINLTGCIKEEEKTRSFSFDFRPTEKQKINNFAMNINMLTKEDLKKFPLAGKSLINLNKVLLELAERKPLRLVSFNNKFTRNFVDYTQTINPSVKSNWNDLLYREEIDLQLMYNTLNQSGILKEEHWTKKKSLPNICQAFGIDTQEGKSFQDIQNNKLFMLLDLHKKYIELSKTDYPNIEELLV